jgi:hypothetical protein
MSDDENDLVPGDERAPSPQVMTHSQFAGAASAPAPAAAPAPAQHAPPPSLSTLHDAAGGAGRPTIRIRELDLRTLHPQHSKDASSGRYIAIGRPGSGKSSVILSLIYAKKHIIPVAQIFSGTEDASHFFAKRFPEAFLFGQLSEDAVGSFVRRQKLAMQYLPECPWALQLIDDCTDDPKILKKPLFQNIYKNGRHFKMLHILSLQYALDLLPSIRSSIDGTFIMREPTLRNRKILWENYASIIPTFEMFCDIMDQLTTDFLMPHIRTRGGTTKSRSARTVSSLPAATAARSSFFSSACQNWSWVSTSASWAWARATRALTWASRSS